MEFARLYLELIDSTAMIHALLAGVTPDEARVKPNPESWSTLETLCHLYDEERSDFRPRLDIMLHRPDAQWEPIHPGAWVTERRYNEQDLAEMKERFFAERSNSLDWLKGLENAEWETTYAAPSGPMKAGDMLVSWAAHDNLSVRQLIELRRTRLENLVKPYDVRYAGDW